MRFTDHLMCCYSPPTVVTVGCLDHDHRGTRIDINPRRPTPPQWLYRSLCHFVVVDSTQECSSASAAAIDGSDDNLNDPVHYPPTAPPGSPGKEGIMQLIMQ